MTTPAEAVVRVQQQELQQAKSNALALRKQLEAVSKELAVCKQQLGATQKALHNAELAKGAHQEYSRHMEAQLERSGKGVALLKAAKLQSELEFLQKENGVLFSDLQAKGLEVKKLQGELVRQKELVDQAAHSVGLPSRQMLEELVELRQQVSQMSDKLLEKDALVERLERDLQDFHVYRGQYKQLEAQLQETQAALTRAETDKTTLLDYIQEVQELESRLTGERDGALAAEKAAQATTAAAHKKVEELQQLVQEQLDLLHSSQSASQKLQREVDSVSAQLQEAQEQIQQHQAEQSAARQQQSQVLEELQHIQHKMQSVLDASVMEQAALGGAITQHTHRALSSLSSPPPSTSKARPAGGKTPHAKAGGRPGDTATAWPQVVSSLSSVTCQLDLLVAQHKGLHEALQKAGTLQREGDKLRQQVQELQARLASSSGRQSQLESELTSADSQWRRLSSALQDSAAGQGVRPLEAFVPGQEKQLVSAVEARLSAGRQALGVALSEISSLKEEVQGLRGALSKVQDDQLALRSAVAAAKEECCSWQARARGLQEELRSAQAAAEDRPSPEDILRLQHKITSLKSQLESTQQQASTLMAGHQDELRVVQSAHSVEVASLQGQLQRAREECEQLRLRVMASQEALVQQEEDLLRYKALDVKNVIRASALRPSDRGLNSAQLTAASQAARAAALVEASRLDGLVDHTLLDGEAAASPHLPSGMQLCVPTGVPAATVVAQLTDQFTISGSSQEGTPSRRVASVRSPAAPVPGKTAAAAWRLARADTIDQDGSGEEDAGIVTRGAQSRLSGQDVTNQGWDHTAGSQGVSGWSRHTGSTAKGMGGTGRSQGGIGQSMTPAGGQREGPSLGLQRAGNAGEKEAVSGMLAMARRLDALTASYRQVSKQVA